MTITTVAQETTARQKADQKIRAEGTGSCVWDPVTGWPPRPHFKVVSYICPNTAPKPTDDEPNDYVLTFKVA